MRRSSTCSSTASSTSTERAAWRAAIGLLAAALSAVLGSGGARAHAPSTPAAREVLRLQGHKQSAGEACAGHALVLSALGQNAAFCAAELRRLALATESPAELEKQPAALDLQGSRALLSRFAKARGDQKVTLLGEWKPGRRDLFLIAVDLCPEE